MPIKVTCKCGQQFAAKDELAGRVVKCPKCKRPLKIGAPRAGSKTHTAPPAGSAPLADLLDEVGFHVHGDEEAIQHCPACDAEMSDHAILCVECGFNLETGKFAKGTAAAALAKAGKREGHAGAADMLLKKAQYAIDTDKAEEKKIRTQGTPTWLLAAILAVLGTFAIAMSVLERSLALKISGFVWFGAFSLASLVFSIRLIVVAFTEDVVQGLLYLFVPFYAFYYIITRWKQCGKLFIKSIVLAAIAYVGFGLVMISGKFAEAPEDTKTTSYRSCPHQQMVVADETECSWIRKNSAART